MKARAATLCALVSFCLHGASVIGPGEAASLPARIELVVGFAPGGGDGQGPGARGQGVMSLRPQPRYDLIARLYARHLHRFLDGRQTLVRHMPGGGSLVAARWLAHNAPRQGGHLAMVSGQALRELALRGEAALLHGLAVIGAIEAGEYVCAARTDLKDRVDGLVFGAAAPGSRSFLHARAFAAAAGLNLRIVSGYANTVQMALAFRRGEVDGLCGLSAASLRSQLGEAMVQGLLRPLARFAPPDAGNLSQIPRVEALPAVSGKAAVTQALRFLALQGMLDWALLGPPQLPPQALGDLRKAYRAMTADRTFRADAVRWGLAVDPVSAAAVAGALASFANAGQPVAQRIRLWSRPGPEN